MLNVTKYLFISLLLYSCKSTNNKSFFDKNTEQEKQEEYILDKNKILKRIEQGQLNEQELQSLFLFAEQLIYNGQALEIEKIYKVLFEKTKSLIIGLRLCQIYAAQNSYNEVEKYALKLQVIYPKEAEPILWLGQIAINQNNFVKAEKIYVEAYKNIKSHDITQKYIEILLKNNKKTEAKIILEKQVQNYTNPVYYFTTLSYLYVEYKQIKKARELLNHYLKVNPNSSEGIILSGMLAEQDNDFIEAEAYYKDIYYKFPQNDVIAINYVNQLIRQKKYIEAKNLLIKLENTSNDETTVATNYEIIYKLSLILLELNEYKEAEIKLNKIADKITDKNYFNFLLAQSYEGQNKYSEAIASYTKVSNDSEYYLISKKRVIYCYYEMNDITNMLNTLDFIIQNKKNTLDSFDYYVSMLIKIAKYQKAQDFINIAKKQYGLSENLALQEVILHEHLHNRKVAINKAKIFLKKYPRNLTAKNYLAYSYAEENENLSYAITLILEVLKIEPQSAFYIDSYAWLLYKNKKYDLAEKEIKKALALYKEEPVVFEHLALILYGQGNYAEALKIFIQTKKMYDQIPKHKIEYSIEWKNSYHNVLKKIEELKQKALNI